MLSYFDNIKYFSLLCHISITSILHYKRRNSLKARPPPLKQSDPYYPGRDRRYADLSDDQISLTESIEDCMDRTRPLWEYKILKDLKKGTNVMVVAHGNTLKGIIKQIDGKEVLSKLKKTLPD